MGFLISKEGVATINEKVKPILEAPTPAGPMQLKSFLGMIQYYHRHLPNLSDKLEPLHSLLRKNVPWIWEKAQEEAFSLAKRMLTYKPIILQCDASPYGLGSVLSHKMEDV